MEYPSRIPAWHAERVAATHGQKRGLPRWAADAIAKWKGRGESPPVEMPTADTGTVDAEAARIAGLDLEGGGGTLDFEEQVRRQRVIVDAHYGRLVRGYRNGSDITLPERSYHQALEQLRKMEKDAARLKIEAGRAWDREEVRAAVKDMVNALNGGLDYLHARLEKRLALSLEQVAAVKEVTSELKQMWRENRLGLEVGNDPS
jgi:hypothetical protein